MGFMDTLKNLFGGKKDEAAGNPVPQMPEENVSEPVEEEMPVNQEDNMQ